MTRQAKGTFEVKMNPFPPYETEEGVQLGRIGGKLAIDITGGNHFYSFDYTLDAQE